MVRVYHRCIPRRERHRSAGNPPGEHDFSEQRQVIALSPVDKQQQETRNMGKTYIRIVDTAGPEDRCRWVPNRDREMRAKLDAQRRNARINAEVKAYRPSDEDAVSLVWTLHTTD